MNAQVESTKQYMNANIEASAKLFKQFISKNKGKKITFVTGYGLELTKIVEDVHKDYFTTRSSSQHKVDGIWHFYDTTFCNDSKPSLLCSQDTKENV